MVEKWVISILGGGGAALPIVRRCPVGYVTCHVQQTRLSGRPGEPGSLALTRIPESQVGSCAGLVFTKSQDSRNPTLTSIHTLNHHPTAQIPTVDNTPDV